MGQPSQERFPWYRALTWLCFYKAQSYLYQREHFLYMCPLLEIMPVPLQRDFLEFVIVGRFQKMI